jgi:hypothetical protein
MIYILSKLVTPPFSGKLSPSFSTIGKYAICAFLTSPNFQS